MLRRIANSRISKAVAVGLALIMFMTDFFRPGRAMALTGGPSQAEFESFEPAGATEMVDLFTGDFTYNIPLMDVDGYPINLSYHANPKMDQEASWVGLGWNINAGAVTRNMRGLPDDFNGEMVKQQVNIEPTRTWGVTAGPGLEIFGGPASGTFSMGLGVVYNNYKGVGFQFGFDATGTIGAGKGIKPALTVDLGIKANTQEGIDINKGLSLGVKMVDTQKGQGAGIGMNIGDAANSRSGLKYRSYGVAIKGGAKEKGSQLSTQGSTPAGSRTYIPNISVGKESFSIGVDFKGGNFTSGLFTHGQVKGYYAEQQIKDYEKDNSFHSYGYLYSQNGDGGSTADKENVIHDFNRDKDGVFHTETPNLPVTHYTYDVFSATGQGIGTSFRSRRSDAGTVYDNHHDDNSTGASLSGEIGSIETHVGANVNIIFSDAQTGIWNAANGNLSLDNSQFVDQSETSSLPAYEASYLKAMGEQTLSDAAFNQSIGGLNAVRYDLVKVGSNDVKVQNSLRNNSGATTSISSKLHKTSRDKRNQSISYLNAAEATKIGLNKTIDVFPLNTFNLDTKGNEMPSSTTSRTATAQPDHLSEITVLSEGGARYVYGIPAYNTKQREVSFNASGNQVDCSNKYIAYTSSLENSLSNPKDPDHYFQAKELPAYAHSYLLTSLLSPDYIDRTGNGPSYDDLGNYTKVNYSRVAGYKWRVPFKANQANYDEGFKSDLTDDKGSYLYGEKEVWYTHSIETKNYIAVFTLSGRTDGYGVNDENGGLNSAVQLQKLDKIALYSKRDVMAYGAHATPIKTVNFEYDYSLCPNTHNNSNYASSQSTDTGKLTLKKVYFTYGKSKKGRLNPYVFYYADIDHDRVIDPSSNPAYDPQAFDRWGNYKPNSSNGCAPHDQLSNSEYPYSEQDKTNADIYSSAWCLNTIDLPSGGTINVDYESDDYAYVQDVRAAQMFKVIGASYDDDWLNKSQNLYDLTSPAINQVYRNNNYLFVDLGTGIPTSVGNPDTYFRQEYLGGINDLYFKFLLRIGKDTDESDFVPGYAKIDIANCKADPASLSGGYYTRGIIKLKDVAIEDDETSTNEANPISKAGWQMSRLYLSQIIYPGASPATTNKSAFTGLLTLMNDVVSMVSGINRMLQSKNYSKEFDDEKSFVRLNNPGKKKVGGGCRVRQIVTKDAWDSMVSNAAGGTESYSEYGQVYTYEKMENGDNISSGVASYEPLLGGDEISLRKPVSFSVKHQFAPDDEYFMDEPMAESLYPAPVVGYSKVTVKSILPSNVTRHGTGHTEFEFYTAKDFPVIAERTPMAKERVKPSLLKKLLSIGVKDKIYLSQGYMVKLNDMHGKPKAKRSYAVGQAAPIASVRYEYRTKQGYSKPELDNDVPVIDKSNVISTKTIGTEIEMISDARRSISDITGFGLGFNYEVSASWLGTPLFFIWPSFSSEETGFHSISTTKVVQQYGLLEKIIATDENSVVSTENLLYDEETGHVLLTKTNNEHEDPVYAFEYPAHWMYDRMSGAYRNLGVSFTNAFHTTTGLCTLSSSIQDEFIIPGDEIEVTEVTGSTKTILSDRYWVSQDAPGQKYLIKRDGTIATFNTNTHLFKVIRSGRRNQQGVSVGAVSMMSDPRVSNSLDLDTKVLNSSAVEMSEDRKIFIGTNAANEGTDCSILADNLSNLQGLLSTLAANSELDAGQGVDLSSSPYSTYYNPLSSYLGASEWYTTGTTSSTLDAQIRSCSECSTSCYITLSCNTPPCEVHWNSITGFSNITYSIPNGGGYTFNVIATFNDGSFMELEGSTSCITFDKCSPVNYYSGCTDESDIVNPYVAGNRGAWYANKSYSYLTGREKGISQTVPDTRDDGAYMNTYKPFWAYSSSAGKWLPVYDAARSDYNSSAPYDKWIKASEVTKVSHYGNVHETQDAIGNYASSLTGYNHTLTTAAAVNAPYRHIGFDGFEDYDFIDNACESSHFNYYHHKFYRTSKTSHTGRYSLQVSAASSLSTIRDIVDNTCTPAGDDVPYTVKQCDNMGAFSPYANYSSDQRFVLSLWAKESTPAAGSIEYDMDAIIKLDDGSSVTTLVPVSSVKGNIIDGWQKLEVVFDVPANTPAGTIEIGLVNNASCDMYFDDVRIQPFNSAMKSMVYDPLSLRLVAELDDRNYATFYEYDRDGILVRIKKETENGIYTIQESRSGLKK
jgi:hypothetical protein